MKHVYFLLLAFFPFSVSAQSPAIAAPQSATCNPSAACLACAGGTWSTPANVSAADGNNATVALTQNGNCFQSSCYLSRYLYAYDFGFSIPTGATIDSIFVDVLRSATPASSVVDSTIRFFDGTNLYGANLADTAHWPSTASTMTYGHTNPLWSYAWTPAGLDTSSFGIAVKAMNMASIQANANVDFMQITVYYTTPTGMHSVSASPGSVKWIDAPGKVQADFFVGQQAHCTAEVFDITGQRVRSFDYGNVSGQQKFDFPVNDLSEGIYICEIREGDKVYVRKVSVVR